MRAPGGHAYGSVYPGPIGAILTPQLLGLDRAKTLPYASTLCGACYEVCPVQINIPEVLLHLRGDVTQQAGPLDPEAVVMRRLAHIFAQPQRYERAQRVGRLWATPLRPQWCDRSAARPARGLDQCARPPAPPQAELPRLVAPTRA